MFEAILLAVTGLRMLVGASGERQERATATAAVADGEANAAATPVTGAFSCSHSENMVGVSLCV